MAEENGKRLPAITIGWDAVEQKTQVEFNAQEFQNYEFVLAVLEMAKGNIQMQQKMAQMRQMQAQAQESARMQALANSLKR